MTDRLTLRSLSPAFLFVVLAACGDTTERTAPPAIADEKLSIRLSVDQDSIPLGSSRQYAAEISNQQNAPRTAMVTWTSTNSAVFSVTSDGLATTVGEGTAQLIASITGAADTALLVVRGERPALSVFPEVISLAVGDDFQLSTEATQAASSNAPVTWSVSDSTIAAIDGNGVLTGVEEGEVTVIASAGNVQGTATVGVFGSPIASVTLLPSSATIAVGASAALRAVARNANGKLLNEAKFTWRSADPSVATVDGDGTVTAVARGFTTVSASTGSKVATATINVAPPLVASVHATLPDSSLSEGQSVVGTTVALDANGRVITGLSTAWQSSNPGVATVTSNGTVKALAAGVTNLGVIVGGKSATIPLTVFPRMAGSIAIVPENPAVAVGSSSQLTGEVRDQNGIAIPNQPITWSSSAPGVASVSSSGLLTGTSQGTATIIATSGALSTTTTATVNYVTVASVSVTPPVANVDDGGTVTLVATPRDAQGNPLTGRVVSWSSSSPAVATVSSTGVVTGVSAGTATITATSDGKSGTATLTVDPPVAASVSVTLNSPTLDEGQTTQAFAQVRDASGTTIQGSAMVWVSSDESIASVSPSGLVTAIAAGTVSIESRTAQGVKGGAALTVTANAAPVASIKMSFSPPTIGTGQVAQVIPVLRDAAGRVLTGRSIGYSSLQMVFATVSPSGLVTGVAAGKAYIVATSGGVRGEAPVTVTSGSPTASRVNISVPTTTLQVGDTARATAQAVDAAGSPIGGLAYTWRSSDSTVVRVATTGRITALKAGSANVSATAIGITGSLGVTVVAQTSAPVASVSFSLNSASLQPGQTTQGTAVLRDAAGNALSGRPIAYSSSNTSVAVISPSGLVTGVSPGSAILTATSGGISGSANLSVTATVGAASVAVTLTPGTIGVGQAATASALVRSASGSVISNPSIAWSSSNTGVATITPAGSIVAIAQGSATITAVVQGVSGSQTLTVGAPSSVRMPELPRSTPTIPNAVLNRPCTDRPTTTTALQSALNAGGSRVICLPMGGVFAGNFNVPARGTGDTSWTVVRADSSFALGRRVTGAERLPRLVMAAQNQPVLHVRSRAARWVFQGLEVTFNSTEPRGPMSLVFVGEMLSERTLAELPSDIHFAHMNVHGFLQQDTRRGFVLNGASHVVRDSRCTEIHERNSDSQCVLSYNGPGPFLIENNLLEAASENIMWGGGDPTIPGLVPCDITVRGNYINKPATWKSIGTPTMSGSYLIKLLYESKNSCRSLIEGNKLEGVWMDGQMGYAVWLKSVNQSGSCRWCRTTDVTFQNNTFRNVGAGFAFSGSPEQFPVDTALSRVLVTGNWIENINVAPFDGDARPILLNVNARDVSFIRNTWAGGQLPKDAIMLDLSSGQRAVTGFRFEDNVMPTAQYGVGATAVGEGIAALNAGVSGGWTFLRNTLIGNQRNNYPSGTRWASSLSAALATGAGVSAPPVP